MRYPSAPRHADFIHGRPAEDPYRWLEDDTSQATREWERQQDILAGQVWLALPARDHFRQLTTDLERLRPRLPGRRVGDLTFRDMRQANGHSRVTMSKAGGPARLVFDTEATFPGRPMTLDRWSVSPTGKYVGCFVSVGGTEDSVLYIVDTATGKVTDTPIDRTAGCTMAWLPDESGYFYSRLLNPRHLPADEAFWHRRIYRHALGTSIEDDSMIFGEGRNLTEFYDFSVSPDSRWLLVAASHGVSPCNDLFIADLQTGGIATPIHEGVEAASGGWFGGDGRLYLRTSLGAPKYRVVVTDPTTPQPQYWSDLVPPRPDAVLSDIRADAGTIIAIWNVDAVSEIGIHDRKTGVLLHKIPGPGPGSLTFASNDPLSLNYEDWITPQKRLTLQNQRLIDWEDLLRGLFPKQALVDVLAQRPQLTISQVQVVADDGVTIPMTLVHRQDLVINGRIPTIVRGYGGFEIPESSRYLSEVRAWAESGGIYAIAHIRGGGERGREWHTGGAREHKERSFGDFINCAEWLTDRGFTTPKHLGALGGSNGGLLVAAALTKRPGLFAAVQCSVPITDMVRFEQFRNGKGLTHELGSVNNPTDFERLYGYSPYHNVRPGTRYPAVIITSGMDDNRTPVLHARKFCAALQWATRSTRPVVWRRRLGSGHGARTYPEHLDEQTDALSFMAHHLGLRIRPRSLGPHKPAASGPAPGDLAA